MWEIVLSTPLWFQVSLVFILGSIIGSFLDVFLMRFHTGHSINGRSHCCSCGKTLTWYELLPVFSYLLQRGRCRNCGAHIPLRLLMMEVGCGGLFLAVFLHSSDGVNFFLTLALALTLLSIALYDLRHFVIPDVMVLTLSGLVLVLLMPSVWGTQLLTNTLPHLLAGLAASGFLASLWLVSKGRWIGLGDAKLAAPLGFLLGPTGAFSFIVLSFWVGAAVSLSLLGLQALSKRGKPSLPFLAIPITMKTEVPFAPFMLTAFAAVYFCSIDVLRLFSYWFYGI